MAIVSVNIDIEDIDTDDIIRELSERKLADWEKEKLRRIVKAGNQEPKSATDLWKINYFMENVEKISLEQLESIVGH